MEDLTYKGFVILLDKNFNFIWQKSYSIPPSLDPNNGFIMGKCFFGTDNNIYITGYYNTASSLWNGKLFVEKTNIITDSTWRYSSQYNEANPTVEQLLTKDQYIYIYKL